jgi:ubiquinone/menaquinone biosynthesis C-methylase UbiE
MLRDAASKVVNQPVSLLLMDGQKLAFGDGTFDAVICQLGLMFMPDPPRDYQDGSYEGA